MIYHPDRVKKAWEETKARGLFEDQYIDRASKWEWGWILPGFLFVAWIITKFVQSL